MEIEDLIGIILPSDQSNRRSLPYPASENLHGTFLHPCTTCIPPTKTHRVPSRTTQKVKLTFPNLTKIFHLFPERHFKSFALTASHINKALFLDAPLNETFLLHKVIFRSNRKFFSSLLLPVDILLIDIDVPFQSYTGSLVILINIQISVHQ